MKRWWALLIPAVVIVVLLGYLVGSRAIPRSAQDNLAQAAAMPAAGSDAPSDIASAPSADDQPASRPEAAAAYPVAPIPSPMPATPRTAASGDAADEADRSSPDERDGDDAEAQAQAEIARAIRSATLRSLDDGEPVRWHKDGLTGYVTVSEPRETATGSCRNVTATMGADGDQRQSSVHLWCQDDDGDWAPR